MHILLTGATGYIGKRLLAVLLNQGHEVTCCVRNAKRFEQSEISHRNIRLIETDFSSDTFSLNDIKPVDAAYYLIHSLSTSTAGYIDHEKTTASNFVKLAEHLHCRQVIYLGGIANDEKLSEHLGSRKAVEEILKASNFATTILRAGIIVGSGSASFEIIRDLVEKLPVMIAPRWIETKCQPIAVRNVIEYLVAVLGKTAAYNDVFDIGGPEVMTYKQMMLQFAQVRKLKRRIYTFPVMTPRLSSYWLYFITSTNYTLAVNLVKSMKVEVVCNDDRLQQLVQLDLINYRDAVERAFGRLEQNMVVSSWIDASAHRKDLHSYAQVPGHGCLADKTSIAIAVEKDLVLKKIWSIGGENGWYYMNSLWKLRGFIDKIYGGVGLRRGRKNQTEIFAGDALDFWRVLVADKASKRLLLFAEMKLPGEAWLEFKIEEQEEGKPMLVQTATFRPRGLSGRVYWHLISPFHFFVFNGMARAIARG
jgi:uncharacterized protein YbjT (DUF2867 family)